MGILNIFKKKEKVTQITPVDEELIERDTIVKELTKKLQSQDAQLSKISAKKREKKIKESEKDKRLEKIEELKAQKYEFDKKKFSGAVSLTKVIKIINDKRYKGKIDITDRNDKVIFGKLKDFLFINGYFGIQDTENRVLSYGSNLRQIIYKPESIANQLRRRVIKLPCNEDYIFIPDIEEEPMPECLYDEETNQIKWAKVREKPLKELIITREISIREKEKYIEKIEQDKVDMVKRIRDLERALRVERNISENSQTELSKAMDKSIQFEQKIGDMQLRVVQLQQLKNMNDQLITGLKEINEELLKKAEEMGTKTEFRKALDLLQSLISWSQDKMPKTIINEIKEAEKENGGMKPQVNLR